MVPMREPRKRAWGVEVALGAALSVATVSAAAGAQEAPLPPNGCGMLMRQASPSAMRENVVRGRALVELQRVTEARTGAAMAPTVQGGGRVRLLGSRGWLGVQASEISETRLTVDGRMVRYCDYPVVVSVEPGSPAARAGIESGDTIVTYNGADLRAAGELALDRLLVPDDTLRVGLRREGRSVVLPVIIGRAPNAGSLQAFTSSGPGFSYVIVDAPDASALAGGTPAPRTGRLRVTTRSGAAELVPAAPMPPQSMMVNGPGAFAFTLGGPSALAGAQMVSIDDDLGEVVGTRSGVLVVKVVEGTPAAAAGLRAGDVIVTAGGTAVTSAALLQRQFYRAGDERVVTLHVVRRGKARDVSVKW
jgi:serine protease Do